jgi:hypothetical protein
MAAKLQAPGAPIPVQDDPFAMLAARLDQIQAAQADMAATLLRIESAILPSSLSRADREQLSRLAPAITGCFGSSWFMVNDLAEHPRIAVVLGGLGAAPTGKLLGRAVGHEVAGYVVRRGNLECGRRLWAVERIVG